MGYWTRNVLLLYVALSPLASFAQQPATTTATTVYGQAGSFTSTTQNNGGITASSLGTPTGVAIDASGGLYLADFGNNRILHYPSGSTTADVVYGQPNFTSGSANNGGLSATSLDFPIAVAVDGAGGLYIADEFNNRVLHFPSGSTTADVVYGQPNLTSNTSNNGGISSTSLAHPNGITVDASGGLYIADFNNNRVLHYPSGSTTADRVYGQPNLTSNTANNGGVSSTSLSGPGGVGLDSSGGLYVSDENNNRALHFPSGSTTADRVYGQGGSFTSSSANNGGISKNSLDSGAVGIAVDSSGGLYLADYYNNRVLHYPSGSTTADQVYCQASFTSATYAASATACTRPIGVALDSSGGLYVTDSFQARALYFPDVLSQTIAFSSIADQWIGSGAITVSPTATSGLPVVLASTTSGVCTVSGFTIALVTTGTCTITANQGGNLSYAAAPQVSRSFQVTTTTQTITFSSLADHWIGLGSFTIGATATSSLTVTFASTTAGVCTVSGTTVSLVALGTCTITANQAGNTSYSAASQVSQSFQVIQAAQTITFGSVADHWIGLGSFTISATATSSLTVTFASTTTGFCTVSGTTVSLVALGTCTITANQAGNTNYSAAPQVSRSFQVTIAAQTITFGSLADRWIGVNSFNVNPSASSGLAVTLVSSTTAICTASGFTVSLVGIGTCSLTASQAGNTNYSSAPSVVQSFQVNKATQTISFSQLSDVWVGSGPFGVSASASSGLTVSIDVGPSNVCGLSGGFISLTGNGTCVVNGTQGGNLLYLPVQSSTSFQVTGGTALVSTPGSVEFAWVQGSSAPPNPATVKVISAPAGAPLSLNASTGSSLQWLNAPSSGSDSVPFTVSVDLGALNQMPVGTVYGVITVSAPQAQQINIPVKLTITAAPPPVVATGGVSTLYGDSGTVQSGSWISIFGSNFSSAATTWTGNFPTSLNGVSVTVDGKPAYLQFAGPNQINLQVPADAATGTVKVVVTTPNGSFTTTVNLAPVAPALNLLDKTHIAAIAFNPDGSYTTIGPPGAYSFPTRAVKPGETLVLYGTGYGATNPPTLPGAAVTSAAPTTNPVIVTIGGVTAPVTYSGIVASGLYQVNVTVPNVPPGDQPIVAMVLGSTTPTTDVVTIGTP